jgi:hypothetical protein
MKSVGLLIGLYICDNIMALDMVRRRKKDVCSLTAASRANGGGRHFAPGAKEVT